MRLEDVARRAKVSVSTVSRVVNNQEAVRPATRRRVLNAIGELNYTPNLQARTLVSGQSKILGIIVSNLKNPFFVDVFHLFEAYATAQGYELLLANTNYDPERLAQSIRLMLGRCVAGIAIAVSEMLPKETAEIIAARTPVVCFNTGEGQPDLEHIRLDSRKGMRKLVEHLYSMGHRRMAYIGHEHVFKTTDERRSTFTEVAETLGIEHIELPIVSQDGWKEGRDAVRLLVDRGFDASGIVCVNDITAFGVLRELHTRGIRVPEEVSVTGFDNVDVSQFACPSLTTAHIPCDEVAQMMIKALIAKPGEAVGNYTVDPEIIVRESTGPYGGCGVVSATQRKRKKRN